VATIADTFLMMFTFQRACDIQVLAQNGGAELIATERRFWGAPRR
jgi:hypothetical protein